MSALLIGSSYVDQDPTVLRTSDIMDSLAADTGETVHLARLEAPDVVYMAKRESAAPAADVLGDRPPPAGARDRAGKGDAGGAAGRRGAPAPARGPPRSTPFTITSRDQLIDELAQVRELGYAVDAQEAGIGLRCFAVTLPFASPSKDAVSCSAPIARLENEKEQEIIGLLLAARETLGRQFGARRSIAI